MEFKQYSSIHGLMTDLGLMFIPGLACNAKGRASNNGPAVSWKHSATTGAPSCLAPLRTTVSKNP